MWRRRSITHLDDRPGRKDSRILRGRLPSGRIITVIWKYDTTPDPADPFGLYDAPKFVITAY